MTFETVRSPAVSLPAMARSAAVYPDDVSELPEGCEINGARARKPIDAIADFVIVGSGAAGATAAAVLAERGFSVAIIEEGPWVRTREFIQDLFPSMSRLMRDAGTAVMEGKAFVPLMQGRCVGGSTTINSAIAWRAPDDVIAGWGPDYGLGDAVTVDKLAPHFDVLERELHVQPISDEALGENNALFGVGAQKLGFESHRIRRYDAGCQGSAGCLTGCRHGKKLSMNITYVPKALRAGGRIFTSSRVDRIETLGGRAVRVVATMAGENGPVALRVHARRGVFVAASTIQTPNILRRSGLRARAIGKHFQAHPGVSLAGMFDRPVQMDFGAAQGFNSLEFLKKDRIKLESIALPPELATARLPGFGAKLMQRLAKYDHLVTWAVVIRAETEGVITDSFGRDKVKFAMSPRDTARARKGLKILSEMMFAAGAREVYPGVHGMPSVLAGPDDLSAYDSGSDDARAYNMIASHMFGAARMGPDPRTSVVGTDFQTHEVQGLYVIDSSVFPTNLGVNPQHTIMAMARLASTRIAEDPLQPV